MANLGSADVTVVEDMIETGVQTSRRRGARRSVKGRYTLVLGGQGSGTNTIPASALGLTRITSCSNFTKSDDTLIVAAAPSAAGSMILLANLAQGTDANRDDPADFTGTFVGYVEGIV